ncbi:hypothetical protein KEM52_001325 [Ascosphaera acerosa]|nr:hypothetical protein KEM52_001325 [Ascosphaera acerosa]
MADTDSFLHIARPQGPGPHASTAPLNVVIQPQAIFSILDHALRRNDDQKRVIGTLLGVRSEDGTEVEIRNCFAVGHTEAADQVEVDMDYQKQMLALHLKANPREVLVGWYATSPELDMFSALIQNFYSSQGEGTWPHPAVHLTISTEPGKDVQTRTYISAPVGVTAERAADSAAFIPVPYEIRYGEADRSGLEAIAAARDGGENRAALFTDIGILEKAVEDVIDMIDRVLKYVDAVMDEEAPASTALGQFLLNTLAQFPKVDPAQLTADFNTHIQDILTVSYLANTIRTQMELSNRLATAQITLGGTGNADAAAGGSAKADGGDKRERGGNRKQGGRSQQQQQNAQSQQ